MEKVMLEIALRHRISKLETHQRLLTYEHLVIKMAMDRSHGTTKSKGGHQDSHIDNRA